MPGIAELALGAAPIAGGALVGILAGNFKNTDYRTVIKEDLDLLAKIPPEKVELREALERSIDERIQDLVVTVERGRELRQSAASYRGNWRDVVLFVCAILFTIVWWYIDHDRARWLPMMVFLIALSVITGVYALRGAWAALRHLIHRGSGGRG